MTLPSWLLPTGAIALLIGGGALALKVHDADVRQAALIADSLKVTTLRLDSLRVQDVKLQGATHRDTLVLAQWRVHYDTVEKRVVLNVHDTVAVIQFVHTADSTIKACTDLVSDCQARTKILTEQVAAVSAERDLYKRQAPNLLQRHEGLACTATGVVGLVAGIVAGKHL